jgi:hypothetical protein
MAYTINLTNGTSIIAGGLSDGTVDTSATSLTLIGKNYAGYGEFLNENLIHLLEHFAAGTSPSNPLRGQLWWDTTNNILKVYSGASWKISTGATSAPFSSPPGDLSALGGDLWFDSTNQQLKIYSGSAWVTVGPVATPATGDTGAFPSIMTDTSGGSHIVTQIRIVGVPYVIISKDTFSSALAGFSLVKAGLNFSTIASPVMGLSTQDINATASTLVQRDPSAGITVAGINSAAINATAVTASTFTGSLIGNVSGNVFATSVTSTSVSASGITASAGYTGTLLTAAQPNITSLGTLTGLAVSGNVTMSSTNITLTAASATLNGSPIARIGDPANFSSINNTPIGNATPSTGAFTTLAGSITTASQTAITGLGNITTGIWSGTTVQPQYGGTGVNNGVRTITLGGNLTTTAAWTLNQNVEINSSPTLRGTNFNSIPNGALQNSTITIGGTAVSLGGSYTAPLNVSSIAGTTNQITASSSTGAVTLSTPQNLHTGANFQVNSLGVGTAASGTAGEIRATNNITAYYSSDIKFKENIRPIPNALDTVVAIGGDLFDWTDEYCESKGGVDGYFVQKSDFGVIAQKVKANFPVASRTRPDGSLAVDYEKLSALAFAAIAELQAEIADLKTKIK